MPTDRAALACLMLAGLWAAPGALASPGTPAAVRILVYPAPGLFDVNPDGSIGGPGGALITKISRASNLQINAVSLPIARAWNTVLAEPNSCVLGMSRTPEREALFQWVSPVSRADFIVYGRADSPPLAPELGALRDKAVVVLRETVTASQLRELGITAQEVTNTLSALRMLQAGRVDYWYSHQLIAEPAASAAGGPPLKALFTTSRHDGYLACNLEVPATTVDQLRQTLQRLRRNGDLAQFGLR